MVSINSDIFEDFFFTNIYNIYQKIFLFFIFIIQLAICVIKTSDTFNSNLKFNACNFIYVTKEKYQVVQSNKNNNSISITIVSENQTLKHKNGDHIK